MNSPGWTYSVYVCWCGCVFRKSGRYNSTNAIIELRQISHISGNCTGVCLPLGHHAAELSEQGRRRKRRARNEFRTGPGPSAFSRTRDATNCRIYALVCSECLWLRALLLDLLFSATFLSFFLPLFF